MNNQINQSNNWYNLQGIMESCGLHFYFAALVIASLSCPMATIDFPPNNYNFSKILQL